jgi:hypothetical protein
MKDYMITMGFIIAGQGVSIIFFGTGVGIAIAAIWFSFFAFLIHALVQKVYK